MTGHTSSADYPTTPGAFDTTFNGGSLGADAFVTKLNAAGSALVYSTFLGGNEWRSGLGHRGGREGRAYVTGHTYSDRLPHHARRLRHHLQRLATDAFVTKLNASGSALVYSTFLGGTDVDDAATASRWTEPAGPT